MANHALALLDTSCVIDWPQVAVAEAFAISTLTVAELAYGLHHDDPLVSAGVPACVLQRAPAQPGEH